MKYQNSETQKSKNKKWPQYTTAAIVGVITFATGIHYGWPSPSLPKLLSNEFPVDVTTEDASYITTITAIGNILAYIIFSKVIDLIGRKVALFIAAPCHILSVLCIYCSTYSIVFLYLGRFIGGIAEGASVALVPIYFAEISESKIRGILLSFTNIFWCGGMLFVNVVGSHCTISTTSLISLSFPVIFMVMFIVVPETPFYLLMKKKTEQARVSLKKLRQNEEIEEELLELQKDVNQQLLSEQGRYQDLIMVRTHRRALLIGCIIMIIDTFSGVSSLTFYAQLFFAKATNTISEELASSLMIVLKLVSVMASFALVDVVGRKPLLLISTAGSCLMLTLLWIFFFIQDSPLDVENPGWVPLMAMVLLTIVYNIGLGNVALWLTSELLSTSVRAKGVCVANIIYYATIFVATKLYQTLSDNYNLGVPLTVFSIAQFFGFFFIWKVVPETKGKSLEEIQEQLAQLQFL